MQGKVAGSSPTSSRWALETHGTRARLGSGRRPSGSAAGVAVRSGRRSCSNHRYRCLFNAGPGPADTQTRKGVYKMFGLGDIGNCQATGDTEARRKSKTSRLRQFPVQQGGARGTGGSFLGYRDREAGHPQGRWYRKI